MTATRACPLCGGESISPWMDKRGYHYVVCGTCRGVWLDPLPSPDAAHALYGAGYFTAGEGDGYVDYESDEALHRRNARDRLARIAHAGVSRGRLVDVGCASGIFLDEARRAGFAVRGVDVSPWARQQAHARGIDVVPSLSTLETGSADVVTFFQALEHVPDPYGALSDARRVLARGGLLVLETWDRGSRIAQLTGRHWQQVSPPSVLYLFDRRSLEALLVRAGFTLESFAVTSKRVSAGFVLGLLAGKYPRLARTPKRLAEATKVSTISMGYGLADLVSVVAHRSAASSAPEAESVRRT